MGVDSVNHPPKRVSVSPRIQHPIDGILEKACPVCGKYYLDHSRSGSKSTCNGKCRWENNKSTPEGKFRNLVNLRIRAFRTKNIFFTDTEVELIKSKLLKGVCEICGAYSPFEQLCIDHDHMTNKFRGILCQRCNKFLGWDRDNLEFMSKVVCYLETSQ